MNSGSEHIARPQPVGMLPIPAGMLLLPSIGADTEENLLKIVAGRALDPTPSAWLFYEHAQKGDMTASLRSLEGAQGAIAEYNRMVLAPTLERLALLQSTTTGELRDLVDVAAYACGLVDVPHHPGCLRGELLALARMVEAAAALEHDDLHAAYSLLEGAVLEVRALSASLPRALSPSFEAQLLSQLASMRRDEAGSGALQARSLLKEALALVADSRDSEFRTDLWMQLATLSQDAARGRAEWLKDAVGAYQQVLRSGLCPEEHVEMFALAHNNLGLLFLSMTMGENSRQLSMAIAIQSFREGLTLCSPDLQPDLWMSLTMNLANALQYLPTSHPEENLVQAVELYEELATHRRKAFDPVSYGKILSNQANALATLGIFPSALEKLQEARKLFEWHNEADLASSAMELAGRIHEQVSETARRS